MIRLPPSLLITKLRKFCMCHLYTDDCDWNNAVYELLSAAGTKWVRIPQSVWVEMFWHNFDSFHVLLVKPYKLIFKFMGKASISTALSLEFPWAASSQLLQ